MPLSYGTKVELSPNFDPNAVLKNIGKFTISFAAPFHYRYLKEHFSEYIYNQVFTPLKKDEKIYFSLEPCDGGYELVLSEKDNKVYKWISSLNEKFSLVYMIATKVVYIKNIKTKTYSPFISGNGKYCRYDESVGKILEINE